MLNFSMSEEQTIMKDTVAKLVKDIVRDNAHEMDEQGNIPQEHINTAWALGATVSMIPEAYGGYGMEYSPMMNAIILEELSYGDMGFAVAAMLPSL
ncbi:MAG: acyl-CoA dehydrogenase family protein, partial [bacterium]|nr:acyl-CoA dehydrogenase family protein [bacterium]